MSSLDLGVRGGGRFRRVANEDVHHDRSIDGLEGSPFLGTPFTEDVAQPGDPMGSPVGVPQVGVAGRRAQRLRGARTTDEDRQPRLDRSRFTDGIDHPIEAAVVRDSLAVEEASNEPDRFVQTIEPFAHARPEVETERVMLSFEPAAAHPQDRAPARHMVEGRRELCHEARIAKRVRTHEEAEPGGLCHRGQCREHRPALELGGPPVTLVRHEVIVDPDRVKACHLRRHASIAECRPIGHLDPERGTEPHARYRRVVPPVSNPVLPVPAESIPTTPTIPAAMRDAVLAWYRASGRVLPFRATRDPYAILVSEVMAQQTRIDRVAEAWTRFLVRFPTVQVLAAATPAEVLRQWRGMGYNRRAVNLHRLAQVVVAEHDGVIPGDVPTLERLPGIGPYTARAVAALAFGAPVGAVDTNVRRVLGRATGSAVTSRKIQELADAAVPADVPGEWTHAVMDVGATFCDPRAPRCHVCPAAPWCRFALDGGDVRRGRTPRPNGARKITPPFATTSRWLRGRILDRLRDVETAAWVEFTEPIGGHPLPDVRRALAALAVEHLLEHVPDPPDRARLPLA